MEKKLLLSAFAVSTLIASWTFAYNGNPGVENPDCTDQERHEQVETMFENKDYATFQTLFDWKWVSRRITTQEDFEKFVELKQAREAGNDEIANSLAEDLGLWQRKMDGTWSKMWKWNGRINGNWQGRHSEAWKRGNR